MNAKALSEDQLNAASGGLSQEQAQGIKNKMTDMRNKIEELQAALDSERNAHNNTRYELGRSMAQLDDAETNRVAKERSNYYKNIARASGLIEDQ